MEIVVRLIEGAFNIYFYMVIAYVLMSWVPQMRETPIGSMLERLVEPYLSLFRKIIPPLGFIDLSPMVAMLALYFAKEGLISLLFMAFL
ncbi:YggT family protein [Brevibacillus daliensis]|uniref:YggT family protein n=1 Tax=Brevibacillus daliensis TaxID=2892995 RepID=UPI001E56F896|nr:YggT family protein [Brevibacillus daliensis]